MASRQTVFVTGATGYIAKHVVLKLLDAGYRVVGSVRSPDRAAEVRDAVLPHLDAPDEIGQRLRFATLDLTSDDGWDEALAGSDALIHTASPFPMAQPDDPDQLIRPAVDGALRALRAAKAAGVGRVVMTSSSVAIVNTALPVRRESYTEDDWTDLDDPGASAYAKSKTMAERAAWAFVRDEAPELALTVINPVFVLGPPLDRAYGTSVKVIERILRAKDPMVPRIGFSTVDVRDVAEMHVRALTTPNSVGQRLIACDRFLWLEDMAEILKAAHPDRKIVTRRAPNMAVRILALFDPAIRGIVPDLGKRKAVSNARAQTVMGMAFRDAAETVRETGAWLIGNRIV